MTKIKPLTEEEQDLDVQSAEVVLANASEYGPVSKAVADNILRWHATVEVLQAERDNCREAAVELRRNLDTLLDNNFVRRKLPRGRRRKWYWQEAMALYKATAWLDKETNDAEEAED